MKGVPLIFTFAFCLSTFALLVLLAALIAAHGVGVNTRHLARALLGLEVGLLLKAVHARRDDRREAAARRFVVLHGRFVVLARDVDAVLCPRQFVLHLHEQLARTELRPRL